MDARARTSSGPDSATLCPACHKPVDALRAGQVAILDGAFRYFCDVRCKEAYVDVVSKRPALDALTADPPPVASGVQSHVASEGLRSSPRRLVDGASARAFAESVEPPKVDASADRMGAYDALGPDDAEALDDGADRADHETARETEADQEATEPYFPEAHEAGDEEAPRTLRSPDTATKPTPTKRRVPTIGPWLRKLGDRLVTAAPIAGIAAGFVSAVVALAGEGANVLRLPLALFASVTLLVRRREHGEPLWWVALAPIGAGAVFASASVLTRDPHADAHATFVGLAAAAAIVVDIVLVRARRDVVLARERTQKALAVTARVVRGDDLVEIDAALVKPGEQVVVEAGETVAVDGIVAPGNEAEVAPWLDSPALVQKKEGDAIVAGAVVVSGRLRVNSTFSGAERAWLRLTEASASSAIGTARGSIETLAPLVVLFRRAIARGVPVAALLVGGAVYAYNGSWLDVAIAACAAGHALGAVAAVSAAALAHARGHAAAQKRGIVYKDALAFDAAARADVAVVCSRGTILLGKPEIVTIEAVAKDAEVSRVLALAAGAEMASTHPFASAILHEARARSVRPDNLRSALVHAGLGVTALAGSGDRVIVGSRAFLLQEKVSVAIADARTTELEAQGRSVLLVAVGGRLVGLLALQDGLRPGARAAIQRLHDARIEPVLLSGEARETCETIARALDIEHVRPEILPAERGAEVRALADDGRVVAAIGHAASDDGALGAADVSIAMEAAGAAPGEWAVMLASDDVREAALGLTVPRACRDRARTALLVGLGAHALGVLGIAFGVAPPSIVPVIGVLAVAAVVTIVRDPGNAA